MPWLVRQGVQAGLPLSAPGLQAAGLVLTGCPAALTAPLESIQAPGWLGRNWTPNAKVPLGPMRVGSWVKELIAAVVWSGAKRCGRIDSGMATWAAAKMTRVMAMAGTARRRRTPAVTPRVKANAA